MTTVGPVSAGSTPEFHAAGWGVLPGFAGKDELAALAAAVHDARLRPGPSCTSRPGNELISLRWCDPVVSMLLASGERMARIRAMLGARDLRWLSAYVSGKPPRSPPLWWHQDWWCWDHPVSFRSAAAQVAVLCYLVDTDERNGALRVLPGSHRQATPLHRALPEPHGDTAARLPIDHPAMRNCPGQATVPAKAGDAVILDYRLLHGTHANRTDRWRDSVLLSFLPDWAGLPDDLRAHLAMHPAIPDTSERTAADGHSHAALFPRYEGVPASLLVNRRPPARFY